MKEGMSPKVGKYNEQKRSCSQCGKPLSGWNKTDRCHSHTASDAPTLESRLKNAQFPMSSEQTSKSKFTFGRKKGPVDDN